MEQNTRRFIVEKLTNRQDAYFTIHWSPFTLAERMLVNRSVPSVGGLAELYYKNDHGQLCLYHLARCFYGGLRSTIRAAIDLETETDERRRVILAAYEDKIFYRYTCVESQADISDIVFFFMKTYMPKGPAYEHSGRYLRIFLKELNAEQLITI
ncbi:MAG: hypothetical protein A2087_06410 [Spirochaetes bacterium GWD1_61_31]|nr:MAG: hypothetical protein A2Y37_09060 [Spirochaetes bacterium GWB1_60_80]OHD31371.1 MAG: hypothetical protein A2004_13345 [Spirochaetes bacterium GWC1_61_12]OHD39985.1 MAG: hypothetical protein A2087_06410 [Spirochaetes bacterium GWD1_61_31]OHD42361.1 MAG: hypothetical protein A2Y35_11590 [Spirochaetes bacterium GWE1_60_18]OHD60533.1 MAG: hypothetical protein A2Y32_03805 [Spirochaetes bacterium GWF1_60_12]HAW86397.1 hypothetical protein [Spirochaetaceae bacterium]